MYRRPLNHLELLTIAERDEHYYKNLLEDDIQELAQRLLGVRSWIRWRNTVTVLSRLGYFGLTTLLEIPTLGEEFCGAIKSSQTNLGFLTSLLNNELQPPKEIPQFFITLFRDVHLITFFLLGDFYELSKRVTNYSYSTYDRTSSQSKHMTLVYKILAIISAIQLLFKVKNETYPNPITTKNVITTNSTSLPGAMICTLCTSPRTEPTSTICGHIFCWNCIHEWLKSRPECPICRTPTESSRLIHLINFR